MRASIVERLAKGNRRLGDPRLSSADVAQTRGIDMIEQDRKSVV